jgi:hypothetical protein
MPEHVDAGWSVREFCELDLGGERLNRRLLMLAEAFGKFVKQLGSPATTVLKRSSYEVS